jgi:hypothetical protein
MKIKNTTTGAGDLSAVRESRNVYLAYVCGAASLRDAESDEIVHRFKGHRSYERHLPYAQIIAKANGWQLV